MTNSELMESFRMMAKIRTAEEAIAADFRENRIFSFLHLSIGQEAVPVGISMNLSVIDRAYGNHRSHGHYLAKGGDLYRMVAEIYGKPDGCCRGFGGSMHMLDRRVGFMGSTPILGSISAIACGSAFQQKAAGESGITVVYIGDGASEEGVFYESVNLAATWNLPILFVVENNHYAVASGEAARRSPAFNRAFVMAGLGAFFCRVDGSNVEAVAESAHEHIQWVRDGKGPAVLEACCFREYAHSGPIRDEGGRLPDDTPKVRADVDPLAMTRKRLKAVVGATDGELDAIIAEEAENAAKAIQRAKTAPFQTYCEVRDAGIR